MIELQHIRLQRDDTRILEDVSLHMKPGEHWVLLGKNGSGKTSLLEIITAYQFPSRGTVRVLSHSYGQVDVREVRKQIGYISQALFEKLNASDPVWQAVASGEYAYLRFYQEIPEALKEKALERLRRIGLERLAENPVGTLSQGERKKVMLARALMSDPRVLIMDEPCSGLDLYERERLLRTIGELGSAEMGLFYVTHHIEEILPIFTHVALLDGGRIVAQGRKEDVLTAANLEQAFGVRLDIDWSYGRPWIRVKPEGNEETE